MIVVRNSQEFGNVVAFGNKLLHNGKEMFVLEAPKELKDILFGHNITEEVTELKQKLWDNEIKNLKDYI